MYSVFGRNILSFVAEERKAKRSVWERERDDIDELIFSLAVPATVWATDRTPDVKSDWMITIAFVSCTCAKIAEQT